MTYDEGVTRREFESVPRIGERRARLARRTPMVLGATLAAAGLLLPNSIVIADAASTLAAETSAVALAHLVGGRLAGTTIAAKGDPAILGVIVFGLICFAAVAIPRRIRTPQTARKPAGRRDPGRRR